MHRDAYMVCVLEQLHRALVCRDVAAVVSSYAAGALATLEGDASCLIPHLTAAHLIERGVPLRRHEVPLALPTTDVELRWHRRVDEDPAYPSTNSITSHNRSSWRTRS